MHSMGRIKTWDRDRISGRHDQSIWGRQRKGQKLRKKICSSQNYNFRCGPHGVVFFWVQISFSQWTSSKVWDGDWQGQLKGGGGMEGTEIEAKLQQFIHRKIWVWTSQSPFSIGTKKIKFELVWILLKRSFPLDQAYLNQQKGGIKSQKWDTQPSLHKMISSSSHPLFVSSFFGM